MQITYGHPAGSTQGSKYPDCFLFLFWGHLLVSPLGRVQPEVREQGCLLMQSTHISLTGHREGGEGNGMDEWKISSPLPSNISLAEVNQRPHSGK